MKSLDKKRIFYCLPRILSFLYIAFISVFALDVFSEPQWLVGLFMHLIPSFILVGITTIAWKNEKLGGFLFIGAGIFFLLFTHFESILIVFPGFFIGVLFILIKK